MQFTQDKAPGNTVLCPIAFASKSLTSEEARYRYIEREVLGIFHSLEKFHQFCVTCKVSVVTAHKALVVIFKGIWQPCHKDSMGFCYAYTCMGYKFYTRHAHKSTQPTGYPGTTIVEAKIKSRYKPENQCNHNVHQDSSMHDSRRN